MFIWEIINDEDPFQCTICLQPFDIDNGKFKIETVEKEFIKDHKIHESEFHKKCIQKWMKDNSSCPICRKILKRKNLFLSLYFLLPFQKYQLGIFRNYPYFAKPLGVKQNKTSIICSKTFLSTLAPSNAF